MNWYLKFIYRVCAVFTICHTAFVNSQRSTDKYLFFGDKQRTYDEGVQCCSSVGYNLVVIQTETELSEVKIFLDDKNVADDTLIFAGVKYIETAEAFVWVSGETFSLNSYWAATEEPNCYKMEHMTSSSLCGTLSACVMMRDKNGQGLKFRTRSCMDKYFILCSRQEDLETTTSASSTTPQYTSSTQVAETTLEALTTETTLEASTTETTLEASTTETTQGLCQCQNSLQNKFNYTTYEELYLAVLEDFNKRIKQNISVTKEILSSTIRARTSAKDERTSSMSIGFGAIFMLILPIIMVVGFDSMNIFARK